MQHAAGGEDADRRTRGLSLLCRAAYTQPERPKGMRERSAISIMLSVLRTGRSLTQARWLHGFRPGVDPGYGDSDPCL
jgi:hypothetical protein